MALFVTHMKTGDNIEIIIPNGQIWGSSISNYSHNPTRRVDMVLGIGYGDDIDQAMKVALDLAAADDRVHKDPAPFIAVSELADSSVNMVFRLWVDSGDYWPVKFDMNKRIKESFDKEGISIPYPQQDVHLIGNSGSEG